MARNENIFITVCTGQKPGNEVMVYTLQHIEFSALLSYPVLINPAAVLCTLSDRGRKRWDETSPAISHIDFPFQTNHSVNSHSKANLGVSMVLRRSALRHYNKVQCE